MLEIIVLPLLPARKDVQSSLLCAKSASQVEDIAASKTAPKSTICWIAKNFKERGSFLKKASWSRRKSSKHQDLLLKLIPLQNFGH